MNIDWKKAWETVRPYLVQALLALLSGAASGVAVHQCARPAVEQSVRAAVADAVAARK